MDSASNDNSAVSVSRETGLAQDPRGGRGRTGRLPPLQEDSHRMMKGE